MVLVRHKFLHGARLNVIDYPIDHLRVISWQIDLLGARGGELFLVSVLRMPQWLLPHTHPFSERVFPVM